MHNLSNGKYTISKTKIKQNKAKKFASEDMSWLKPDLFISGLKWLIFYLHPTWPNLFATSRNRMGTGIKSEHGCSFPSHVVYQV